MIAAGAIDLNPVVHVWSPSVVDEDDNDVCRRSRSKVCDFRASDLTLR